MKGFLTTNLSENDQFHSAVFLGAYVGHEIFPPLKLSFWFPFSFGVVFKAFFGGCVCTVVYVHLGPNSDQNT